MSKKKMILLVEDNPADVELAKLALQNLPPTTALLSFPNGNALFNFLKKNSANSISLILLDLNMPHMNGFDLLKALRKDGSWKKIPVVIFSSSRQKEDIDACYDLGANAYVSKPFDLTEFKATLQQIVKFWNGLNLQSGTLEMMAKA